MKIKNLKYLGAFFIVLVMSCEGPEGEVGPAGPSGANGATGPTGPSGPEGSDGLAGTDGVDGIDTEVTYSDWFESGTWTNSNTTFVSFDRNSPGVTQNIIDKGVVLAYTKLVSDAGRVRPLPASLGVPVVRILNFFIPAVGTITFTAESVDGSTFNPATTNEFRYVIIPGATLGGRIRKPDLDYSDYEAVTAYYNIPN